MEIIFLLLPLSTLFALIALVAYLWSVKTGQLDDLETPAIRAVFDDEEQQKLKEEKPKT